ncbi:phage tail protein [Pedobacter sp. NJ-S-72]
MEDFLGSIVIFSFGFAPRGYAQCNGQLMPINQNQALFSLLGTTYGGDGRVSFGLPDLRGRTPLHVGSGFDQGQKAGEESHTIIPQELPQHLHNVGSGFVKAKAGGTAANMTTPENNYYAANPALTNRFSNHTDTGMYNSAPFNTGNQGGSLAHENRMPFLVLNFTIALTGIFPSRN